VIKSPKVVLQMHYKQATWTISAHFRRVLLLDMGDRAEGGSGNDLTRNLGRSSGYLRLMTMYHMKMTYYMLIRLYFSTRTKKVFVMSRYAFCTSKK